ncbi:MAG: DNA-binding NarL/FixJ family response regulator [Oceanicoccus sp.]|jgi:DNA-binding NarL/FixJ family response regulator
MKILIVDDHHLIRAGLEEQLKRWFSSANVLAADSAKQAIKILEQQNSSPPDIAMVDLFMPDGDGFEFIRQLCNLYPDIPILVLSASQNPSHIRKSISMGASGYIAKASSSSEMLRAIKRLLAGGSYMPTEVQTNSSTEPGVKTLEFVKTQLTARQLEILSLMAEGLSNKEIAEQCNLAYNTVKVHVSAILKALDLNNRIHATILAKNLGLATD